MVDQSDIIFDVGAHKGEDSAFYLKLGYRVVAVEANPVLVRELKERFKREIANGTYTVIDKAIADGDGDVSFFVNEVRSVWSTTDPAWAVRNERLGAQSHEITVPSIRFAEILQTYGCPHYLKIDIEGADMLCLRDLGMVTCRPKYLSMESSKTSWAELVAEFDALEQMGYTRFQVVDQFRHKAGTFRDRSNRDTPHTFDHGASGPFGSYLTGRWLSKRRALRRYLPIFLTYKMIGDYSIWVRWLGRLPLLGKKLPRAHWYDTHAARD
ncbi:MAG: FkbM family methyltransferase [Gemmatimonadales bacterium]